MTEAKALPRISIVTPSYNQGEFLERTLNSVLDQKYPDLEYMVMDGGSTDGSVEIIRQYADRLAYWESIPDRGQAHAINKGFAHATGEVLAWVNSDDTLLPGTLARVGASFRDPRLAFSYGQRKLIDADDRFVQDVVIPPCPPLHFMVYSLANLNQEACFWTAALYRAAGPLNERYDQAFDYDLILRLIEAADAAHLRVERTPAFLAGCRYHPAQKTLRYDAQGRRLGFIEALEIRDAYRARHHIPDVVFWPLAVYYRLYRKVTMRTLPWPRTHASMPFWRRARELLR